MALDIGQNWLGTALSDPLHITVSPLGAQRFESEEEMLDAITGAVDENAVSKLVIGLPKLMDGTRGEQALKIISMAERIKSRTGIPVVLQDERFSTFEAREILRSKKANPRSRDDALAAAVILRDYLKTLPAGH